MKLNLDKRFFLKKILFCFFFILCLFRKKNVLFYKKQSNKDLEILKNFYFAKKKYHKETTSIIFKNFINDNKSMKTILYNIEKRRTTSNYMYRKNIKYII